MGKPFKRRPNHISDAALIIKVGGDDCNTGLQFNNHVTILFSISTHTTHNSLTMNDFAIACLITNQPLQ